MISAAERGSFMRVRPGFETRPATGGHRPPGGRTLVGARGFEPPTSRSRTVRATRLRYAPTRPAYCTQAGHASHAYFPTSLTNLHSPHSRVFISPPTFSTSVSTWHRASPIGTTIRPPSTSWAKSGGGTAGPPAVTRIRSNGASSGQPRVPLPTRTHTFV